MMIADDFSLIDAAALGCSSGATPLDEARAKGMTSKKRKAIAKRAAKARWKKTPVPAEEGEPWHHRVPLGVVFFPSLEYALG
jgi:hypothetical protein